MTRAERHLSEPPSAAADPFACALHEVSNALTVVLGWMELGLRADGEEELRKALVVALEHARRGQTLARRAIGAEADSDRGGRSGSQIAEFAAVSIRPAAIRKAVEVQLELGPGSDGVALDETTLLQVLTNLLLNAIEFSPEGSKVLLSVDRDGDGLCISVHDEGPGVPPDRQNTLFSLGETTRKEGAGIGLVHSRGLARQRGGNLVYVDTARGARFELTWPVARSTAMRPSLRAPDPMVLAGQSVLLIEDDGALAVLVEMSLEARGASLCTARTLAELESLLSDEVHFDVVLLDLSPLEDQLSHVLDRLRDNCPSAAVVLMSGDPAGVPSEGVGRFVAWIRKPFEIKELVRVVVESCQPSTDSR